MERKKMKKKGFTLVELLVVIAIIAMLLAILMPALGKVRQLAQRIMCGTNIGGLGKAILTYATDDKYESYPIAGNGSTVWDFGTATKDSAKCTWDWKIKDAPGTTNNAIGTNKATLSANLYLLIKYADVSPDQFICPGSDEKKFELSTYTIPSGTQYGQSFTDVWDFGASADVPASKSRGRGHNSYSYQLPMQPDGVTASAHPVSGISNPAMAVIADRNPFWDFATNGATGYGANAAGADLYKWDSQNKKVAPESIPLGNNVYHQKDGQNVMYVDQHVKFEKSANCGVQMDNIYTTWQQTDAQMALQTPDKQAELRQCGGTIEPQRGSTTNNYPQTAEDNYLVNDYN